MDYSLIRGYPWYDVHTCTYIGKEPEPFLKRKIRESLERTRKVEEELKSKLWEDWLHNYLASSLY